MRKITLVFMMGLLALSLVGCAGQSEETPTPAFDYDYVPVVSVTGEVVPEVWAVVSAQAGGSVVEVLVEPGGSVAAGDLLVQIDPTDRALAVQQAEAALEASQAQLALLEAAARSEEIVSAVAELQAAQATVSQATAERNRLGGGAVAAEIAAAEVGVAEAEAAYRTALFRYDDLRANGKGVEDWVKEEAALQLRAAEQLLEAAQMRLAQVQGSAGARFREADAAIQAAEAQQDIAEAQLDLLQAGATAKEIAVAQVDVAQAQVELDATQVALARCELRAPFDGTVGAVDVRVGELVAPGQPLLTLGDLTTLRVETTDLDEIDVARVEVGQQADVTFDAVPEQVFVGRVTRISPMAEPGAGGVNYTVIVELGETGPAILWGMTAFVDIEGGG